MRHVIKGKTKGAFKEFGYSADDLKRHLEQQFQPGMTWDNYGLYGEKWHVDHKQPVCTFKLPEELVQCFALSNLQPLWAKDNLAKSWRFNNSVGDAQLKEGPGACARSYSREPTGSGRAGAQLSFEGFI